MNALQKDHFKNTDVLTLTLSDRKEFFFTSIPSQNDSPEEALVNFFGVVRETGAQIVSLEIFGGPGSGVLQREVIPNTFGNAAFPVTWVEEKSGSAAHITGIQAWGIDGIPVLPILFEGNAAGTYFDTPSLRYCRLGGILPTDADDTPPEQATAVFQRMDAALQLCDMQFNQVMRTWFFNHHLLDWYDVFNVARDVFFRKKQMYHHVVPASTGIEGGNAAGSALEAGALAVSLKGEDAAVCMVPSPLQCAALEYGSTFSRAAEIREPGLRRIYISGTASISPDGRTQFEGDVAAQIKRTMEVVKSILHACGMELSDSTRVTTYFKNAEDIPAFEAWRIETKTPAIPVVCVHNDVCRHDLLFEIELDALSLNV